MLYLAPLILAQAPFPPAAVTGKASTVAAAVTLIRARGLPLEAVGLPPTPCDVAFDRTPALAAAEAIAAAVNGRLTLADNGRVVRIVPRGDAPPLPSAVAGPFRVAVRQVSARLDTDAGRVVELTLDCHWEPRLAVVRVSADPTLCLLRDNRGSKLTAPPPTGRAAPTGAAYTATVRIRGVPRSASTLDVSGSFTVTAAERLLRFAVPSLAGPSTLAQDGVTVTVPPPRRADDVLIVTVISDYPAGHPLFESFESWTASNRCRLVGPGGRALAPTDFAVSEGGRRAEGAYRFPTAAVGNPARWGLEYDTPGPLREFAVRFELRGVPLP
jgi:hypothetical protein